MVVISVEINTNGRQDEMPAVPLGYNSADIYVGTPSDTDAMLELAKRLYKH